MGASASPLLHVLAALLAIIVASRLVGMLFRSLHQPAVIGEVLAGILLGPSLLGKVAPPVSIALFPASVIPMSKSLRGTCASRWLSAATPYAAAHPIAGAPRTIMSRIASATPRAESKRR